MQADQVACRLACETVRVLLPLAKVAAAVIDGELWRGCGYSSVHDFTREELERSSKWLRLHAALHRAVVRLPGLRGAVTGEDGGAPIGMSKALLVARVASVETLASWVERARRLTVDELRAAVIGGDGEVEAVAPSSDDIAEVPGVLWGFSAPPSVRAAFDSALDLYRRLEGGDATVTSFIEALVAEDFSSDQPPDVFQEWLRTAEPRVDVVEIPLGNELPALVVARELLQKLDETIERAGVGSERDVLGQLQWFVTAADLMERHLASLLVEMSASGLVRELGFSSIGAYAENRLGLSRTSIEDRARVSRSLARRPRVQRAYVTGAIGLEKVLLAVQILGAGYVDASSENEWVAHLKECTVKRLRDEKRALLFAASVEGRVGAPAPMTDEAWLASLRCAPGDTAVAVQRAGHAACSNAPLIPIAGSVLRWRLPIELARDFGACIETRCRYLALDAAACDWSQPINDDDPPSWRAARAFSTGCRRLPPWVGLLAMLEEFCAQYDQAEKRSASHSEVFVRARHRCEAPGCTSRRVEWHHRQYRSRGGSDHYDNGDALCPTHHRHGQHGGYMQVIGDTPVERMWRLGPARNGVWYRNERRIDATDRDNTKPR